MDPSTVDLSTIEFLLGGIVVMLLWIIIVEFD